MLLHPIIGLSYGGIIGVNWLHEHHVPDPLHTRRSGFAESKGQSSVVVAC